MIQLIAAAWMAGGVIPALIFERWLIVRYSEKPDKWSALRLAFAFLAGPIAFAAIAVVMSSIEEDEEEE